MEQQETAVKAKKGKLPLIVMMAVVLAAGGFFGMKMKGGEAKKPEVKLGAILPIEDEFLVPLSSEGNYLRTNISLHLADGIDGHAFEANLDAVRDTVNMTLKAKSIEQVQSVDGLRLLKRELAENINHLVHELHPEEEKAEEKPSEKEEEHAEDHEDGEKAKKGNVKHPTWDSDKGPVLKIYFTTFATQ